MMHFALFFTALVDGTEGRLDASESELDEAHANGLPDEPYDVLLTEWRRPPSHGRHHREPNHAGLFRVALGVDDTRASYEAMSASGWVFDRPPVSPVQQWMDGDEIAA